MNSTGDFSSFMNILMIFTRATHDYSSNTRRVFLGCDKINADTDDDTDNDTDDGGRGNLYTTKIPGCCCEYFLRQRLKK